MSIQGRNSTAAMLARAGFIVVLVLVNVSGFRLVLARGWHERMERGRVEHLPRPGTLHRARLERPLTRGAGFPALVQGRSCRVRIGR